MSDGIGNRAMELAATRVDQERDALVARVRAGVGGLASGATLCACGELIPPARREAVPQARDCIDCASTKEGRKR